MAQLAFGIGGAALAGGLNGGSYAGLGFAAGGMLYSILNPPDDIIQEGNRLNNQLTTTSAYGVMRPIIYGTIPVNGNIIDGSPLYETRHEDKSSSGGKGGIGGGQDVVTVTYTYSIDLAVALGEGPIDDVLQVYANDKLIFDITADATITSPEWLNMTVYKGDETQQPDPTLQVLHGADTPAYRGEAYVVFTRFQLQEFGNNIPSFRFLVVSKSDPVISEDTKDFNTSGDNGALLYNRNTSLIYYANTGQTGTRIGYVYDPLSESEVISLRWSDDFDRIDEEAGGGLFSMPNVVEGVNISSGPNAHFFVNVEDGNSPAVAIYNSVTGAYLGLGYLGVLDDSNTKTLVSDERKGIVFRNHFSFNNFESYLEAWDFALVNGGINRVEKGRASAPLGRSVLDWVWDGDPSYPEGTNRNGLILIKGQDKLDGDKLYLCLVNNDSPPLVEKYTAPTEFSTITAIAYDTVQDYFWVMGQSDTAGQTRLKAYDIGLNEVFSVEWANTLYTFSQNYFTYDNKNFSLWLFDFATGIAYQWHTINHEFVDTYPGFSTGSIGAGDSLVYVNATRTLWRKKGSGLLDLYRLGRIVDSGVGLDVVIDDLCKRAGLDLSEYDVSELATTTVDGYKIEKDGTVRSKITPLQQTYLFDGIDKADEIEFKFRGASKTETIPQNDLGATTGNTTGGEFIKIDRIMDLDLPKKTEVSYYNRAAEYEQNTQMARRLASFTDENSTRYTLPIVLTDDEGAQLADVYVHLPYIEREVYDVSALPKWQFLTNGDVIGIQYEGREFVARIIQKDFEDGIVKLKCTREDSSVLTSFLEGGSAPGRDVSIRYNPLTNSVHLDIPLLLETNDNAGYYLSACGMDPSWTGGNIYKSADGNSFNILATVLTPSVIGTMDQALGNAPDHLLWDRTSTARVYMRCGTLSSVTETEALQGANTAVIGAHGRWEVINFVNATLVEEGVYDIDTFLRGRLGTEWAPGTHQLGDIFCMLTTDDLTYITDNLANLNIQFLMRAVSLGGSVYSDRVIDQFHTNTGVSLKPYAPAGFEAIRQPNLDILFQWRERSRYPVRDYWSGVTSGNNTYSLDIKDDTGSIIRTENAIATESYLYLRADQISDGLPSADNVAISADGYQVSTVYPTNNGRGYPAVTQTVAGPVSEYLNYALTLSPILTWEYKDLIGTTSIKELFNPSYNMVPQDCDYENPSLFNDGYGTSISFQNFEFAVCPNINPVPLGGPMNWSTFSVSMLVQFQEIGTHSTQDFLQLLGNGGRSFAFHLEPTGNLRAVVNLGSGETFINHGIISVGQTYHLVATIEDQGGSLGTNNFKFYVDGQLSAQGDIDVSESVKDELLRVNSGRGTLDPKGQNDLNYQQMIIIYDRVLNATEISNLYSLT